MQVQYLGREDPLEEEMAPYSSISAWGISQTALADYSPYGCKGLDTTKAT